MLNLQEITIKEYDMFQHYIRETNSQISEMTFANFLIWQHVYRFRFAVYQELLICISDHKLHGPFALMPIGTMKKDTSILVINKLREYFHERGWVLKFAKVTQNQIEYIKEIYNIEAGNIVKDSDEDDYVYLTRDLILLKGKKYDGKRNHISHINKHHQIEYVTVNQENIHECHHVLASWYDMRTPEDQEMLLNERIANKQLVDHFFELGLKGALLKVDGQFEAFTAGEMLNSSTAVIHAEKANPQIQGLYTITNQMFCEKTWRDVEFINREQDMGILGIRRAKQSYHPVKMIEKYIIVLN